MPETLRFRVAAGYCAECSGDVGRTLAAIPGVEQVEVLDGAGVIAVAHDGRVDADTVRRAAAQHNLTLIAAAETTDADERPWWRDPFVVRMAIAGVLLAVTLVAEYLAGSEAVATVFGAATIIVGGAHYLRALEERFDKRRKSRMIHGRDVAIPGGRRAGVPACDDGSLDRLRHRRRVIRYRVDDRSMHLAVRPGRGRQKISLREERVDCVRKLEAVRLLPAADRRRCGTLHDGIVSWRLPLENGRFPAAPAGGRAHRLSPPAVSAAASHG